MIKSHTTTTTTSILLSLTYNAISLLKHDWDPVLKICRLWLMRRKEKPIGVKRDEIYVHCWGGKLRKRKVQRMYTKHGPCPLILWQVCRFATYWIRCWLWLMRRKEKPMGVTREEIYVHCSGEKLGKRKVQCIIKGWHFIISFVAIAITSGRGYNGIFYINQRGCFWSDALRWKLGSILVLWHHSCRRVKFIIYRDKPAILIKPYAPLLPTFYPYGIGDLLCVSGSPLIQMILFRRGSVWTRMLLKKGKPMWSN